MLGVEGVLRDGAHGCHDMEVFLLEVEVAKAHRQSGVLSLSAQRGTPDGCEGSWAEAIRRNNFTVWNTEQKRENVTQG